MFGKHDTYHTNTHESKHCHICHDFDILAQALMRRVFDLDLNRKSPDMESHLSLAAVPTIGDGEMQAAVRR